MDSATQDRAYIHYLAAIWVSVLTEEATPEHLSNFCEWLKHGKEHRGIFLQMFEDMIDIPSTACPSCAGTGRGKRFVKNGPDGLPDVDRWNALIGRHGRILRNRRSLRIRLHLLCSDVLDVIAHSKWRWLGRAALRVLVSTGVKSGIAHIEKRRALLQTRPRVYVPISSRQRLWERLAPYRQIALADIPIAAASIEEAALAFAIHLRFRQDLADKHYSDLNAWLDVDHRHLLAFVRTTKYLHICISHC